MKKKIVHRKEHDNWENETFCHDLILTLSLFLKHLLINVSDADKQHNRFFHSRNFYTLPISDRGKYEAKIGSVKKLFQDSKGITMAGNLNYIPKIELLNL